MKKGKLIVIDGTDGSGKATQTELLVNRLKKEKIKVKKIDFPQYTSNFFGGLIKECLQGKYGDFLALNAKIASVLYAADRWESSKEIKKWLDQGYIIIADRYVSANQIHQGGKIIDDKKRKEFLEWLDKMEFGVFKIPKPDAVIFLHLPIEITLELIRKRAEENEKKSGKADKDLAEENAKHLEDTRKSALKIVQKSNKWFKIECSKKDQILSREEIHEKVYDLVRKII
jgi:dTMP kinase